MRYEDLKLVCQYVSEKTGVELNLKFSKFITDKKLEKESNYLEFFDYTAKNGRDRLMQRKYARELLKKLEKEHEKEYMIKYIRNLTLSGGGK